MRWLPDPLARAAACGRRRPANRGRQLVGSSNAPGGVHPTPLMLLPFDSRVHSPRDGGRSLGNKAGGLLLRVDSSGARGQVTRIPCTHEEQLCGRSCEHGFGLRLLACQLRPRHLLLHLVLCSRSEASSCSADRGPCCSRAARGSLRYPLAVPPASRTPHRSRRLACTPLQHTAGVRDEGRCSCHGCCGSSNR